MMNIFSQITLIYFAQIADILAFIGFGYTFCNLLNINIKKLRVCFFPLLFLLTGIVFVTPIAAIINFFLPINHIIACLVLLIGIILFCLNQNKLTRIIKPSIKSILLLALLINLLGLLWGIQIADTFGYHVFASKWVAESCMPFGQANLDIRLGYNSLIFTTYAITEFLVFKFDRPIFSFFPVLMSLFIFASAYIAKKMIYKRKSGKLSDYYLTSFIIIPFIYNRSVGSLATDLSAILFAWATFYLITVNSELQKDNQPITRLIVIFSVFTATIKLSMAPICLIPGIIIGKHFIKEKNLNFYKSSIVISLLILLLFVTKGYMQSGYPAFPNHLFSLNVDWKVPEEIAKNETEFICNFAKDYSHCRDLEYMKTLKWIPRWIINFIIYERALWLSMLISGLFIIAKWSEIKLNSNQKLITYISMLGIVFVMVNAPAARFAHVFLFTSFFIPLCALLSKKQELEFIFSTNKKITLYALILLSISLLASFGFIYDNYFGNRLFNAFVLKLFPATQTRSLPFVYAAFSIGLLMISFLMFFVWKKIKNKPVSNKFQVCINSKIALLAIIFTSSLAHIGLELPAIFANHKRFSFPNVKTSINSQNGITTYFYQPYICNYNLLATTIKHEVKVEKNNNRYYFFPPKPSSSQHNQSLCQ